MDFAVQISLFFESFFRLEIALKRSHNPFHRINTFTPGFIWNNKKDHEPQYVRERWFNPRKDAKKLAKRQERRAQRLAEGKEPIPRRNFRTKEEVIEKMRNRAELRKQKTHEETGDNKTGEWDV